MSDSLKNQLLALGFKAPTKPAPAPEATPRTRGNHGPSAKGNQGPKRQSEARPGAKAPFHGRGDQRQARPVKPMNAARGANTDDMDLAKAYALRARVEREEQQQSQREAAEKARLKAERKAEVAKLLEGAALNLVDAEHPRNFEYGGKIRRVYVDVTQLEAVNRGELGILQHKGRFLIVRRDLAIQVQAIEPALLALLVDPNSPSNDDVPADLVW